MNKIKSFFNKVTEYLKNTKIGSFFAKTETVKETILDPFSGTVTNNSINWDIKTAITPGVNIIEFNPEPVISTPSNLIFGEIDNTTVPSKKIIKKKIAVKKATTKKALTKKVQVKKTTKKKK